MLTTRPGRPSTAVTSEMAGIDDAGWASSSSSESMTPAAGSSSYGDQPGDGLDAGVKDLTGCGHDDTVYLFSVDIDQHKRAKRCVDVRFDRHRQCRGVVGGSDQGDQRIPLIEPLPRAIASDSRVSRGSTF